MSARDEREPVFVEMPVEMKRSLEALAVEYKRQHHKDRRSLSAVVRYACDQLLRRDLPGYVSPYDDSPAIGEEA